MTTKTDAVYRDNIFRKDYEMIFAANRHLASVLAIKTQLEVELKPGQVMARDAGDGLYKKFSAVSGGSYDSICVLFDDLSENEATGTSFLRGIFSGDLYEDKLIDLDSTAKTAMGARSIVDASGDKILKF